MPGHLIRLPVSRPAALDKYDGTVLDASIRGHLRRALRRQLRGQPDAKVVEELGIREGRSRVDMAVVNGFLIGYEIKSAADSLRRLPTQVQHYGEVLDYATLVTTEGHLKPAKALLPDWWEILLARTVRGRVQLDLVRERRPNPGINKRALTELLWHDDALALLHRRDAARGLARKRRALAWDRIVDICTLDEIRDEVRMHLKRRVVRESARRRA
jgi:hypothetical protein